MIRPEGINADSLGSHFVVSTHRLLFPVAAVAAAGLLLTTGCSEQAAAIRVDDSSISHSELMEHLEAVEDFMGEAVAQELAPPTALEGVRGEMSGSYSHAFVAQNVQDRVFAWLVEEVLDEQGIEVTEAERVSALQQLQQDPVLTTVSESFQAQWAEDSANLNALRLELCPDYVPAQNELCPEVVEALQEQHDRSDISVSSKLGTWDKGERTLVPPEGPLVVSDESESLDEIMPGGPGLPTG